MCTVWGVHTSYERVDVHGVGVHCVRERVADRPRVRREDVADVDGDAVLSIYK